MVDAVSTRAMRGLYHINTTVVIQDLEEIFVQANDAESVAFDRTFVLRDYVLCSPI